MRILIALSLILFTFLLWLGWPEYQACHSGPACIAPRIGILAISAMAVVSGLIGLGLYFSDDAPISLKPILTVFIALNAGIILYNINSDYRHSVRIEESRARDVAYQKVWTLLYAGKGYSAIASEIRESYLDETVADSFRSKEQFAIRMSLAMRSKKDASTHIPILKPYAENGEVADDYLDEYFERDFEFIQTHQHYGRFFELMLGVLGNPASHRYEPDDIYVSRLEGHEHVLKNFSMQGLVEKGFEDLIPSSLALIKMPLDEALKTALSVKAPVIREQAITTILKNLDFRRWPDGYTLDPLLTVYEKLRLEEGLTKHLHVMQTSLKHVVNAVSAESWHYHRTDEGLERFMRFYNEVHGIHNITEHLPKNLSNYYLAEDARIQALDRDNYRMVVVYLGGSYHQYLAYINGKLIRAGHSDKQGRVRFKAYGATSDSEVLIISSLGNFKLLLRSPPAWDSDKGFTYRIRRLMFSLGEHVGMGMDSKERLISTYEQERGLPITGKYDEAMKIRIRDAYKAVFHEGWMPVEVTETEEELTALPKE